MNQSVKAKPLHYEVNLSPKEELQVLSWFFQIFSKSLHTVHSVTLGLIYFILPLIYKTVKSSPKGAVVLSLIYFMYYIYLWKRTFQNTG